MQTTMTVDQIAELKASDVDCRFGETVSVAESGPYLDEYYQTTPRYNYRGGVTGHFWTKVNEVADILKGSDEWPFEPIEVCGKTLLDGHHRSNAAIVAGWDKPIPVVKY